MHVKIANNRGPLFLRVRGVYVLALLKDMGHVAQAVSGPNWPQIAAKISLKMNIEIAYLSSRAEYFVQFI